MTARVDRAHRRAKFNPLNFLLSFIQTNRRKIIRPLFALFIILVIWQLLCLKPDGNFPGPIKVIQDTWDPLIINPFFDNGGTDKGLFLQVFESLKRVAIGFSFSAIIGIGLGILVGTNPFMFDALDPIFQVLRTIPPLAWLPIALAIFQQFNPLDLLKISTSETSALFVIFITSIWPIIINTTVGVQQIPQDYRNVARVLRLPKKKYFTKILFPSAVPYIFTGLRIGIGLSWLAIIAAEMLVGGVGIGFFIWDSYNSARISQIILALIYVGVIGLLLDRLVGFIASKVVPEERK